MRLDPRVLRAMVAVVAIASIIPAALSRSPEVTVSFVYSSDANSVLAGPIAEFNHQHEGSIRVLGEAIPSGDALSGIAGSTVTPTLWMPASSVWARMLDDQLGAGIAPGGPSFFWSPEVIAMWQQMVQALHQAGQPIGWEQIVALATGSETFAGLGLGGRGLDPFRWGHTKPTKSTSGVFAVASEFQVAHGAGALSPSDIDDPRIRGEVRRTERAVVHYGDIGKDFCPLLHTGYTYVSAVYLQETVLRSCKGTSLSNLVEVLPNGGTYVADYPAILLHAAWISDAEARAAQEFRAWLGEALDRGQVDRFGFRPGNPPTTVVPPLPEGGDAQAGSVPVLDPLDPAVLEAIRNSWSGLQERADVVLVMDRSTNMSLQDPGDLAVRTVTSVVGNLEDRDRAALVTYSNSVNEPVSLATPLLQNRRKLTARVTQSFGSKSSESRLYDALMRAMDSHELRRGGRIHALVVVGTGLDSGSSASSDDVLHRAADLATGGSSFQIFTVGFGDQAGDKFLQKLAKNGRGLFYDATRGGVPAESATAIADAIAGPL